MTALMDDNDAYLERCNAKCFASGSIQSSLSAIEVLLNHLECQIGEKIIKQSLDREAVLGIPFHVEAVKKHVDQMIRLALQ